MVSLKVSVCGWSIDAGVGRELVDAANNLPITGAFLIAHREKRNRFDLVPNEIQQVSGGLNPVAEMEAFIDKFKPDTILTWEWPGRWEFPEIWARHGVRWVNVVHWDWFPADHIEALKSADLVSPNRMCQDGLSRLGLKSELLPVPIDLSRFRFSKREQAMRFGMAYGSGGPHGRRSLAEVLEALERIQDPPPFTVRSQIKCPEFRPVKNAGVVVENTYDPSDLYRDVDVAIQPSKFEGVGLSLLEAQACGVPVITVDADPMRELAPDLLAGCRMSTVENMTGATVEAWTPDVDLLCNRIQSLYRSDIRRLSEKARKNAERFSWELLKDDWKKYLEIA